MYTQPTGYPKQKLLSSQKNKKWRKDNVEWADMSSQMYDNVVRQSLMHKKINYDLYDGKLHLSDMKEVLNPFQIDTERTIPNNIQYYSIVNSPINTLIGEESKRRFEFRAIVSNSNAISEKERERSSQMQEAMLQLIKDQSISEEDFNAKVAKYSEFFAYEWQDVRERSANFLLSHYIKELDMKLKWNSGMKDVAIVGEELYDIDVCHGEPTFERLNPRKVFVLRNGYSSRAEDSDLIIMQDYWSPGRIADVYHDELSQADVDEIQKMNSISKVDDADNIDERSSMVYAPAVGDEANTVDQMIYFAGAMGRTLPVFICVG